jgi:hypothetical protein
VKQKFQAMETFDFAKQKPSLPNIAGPGPRCQAFDRVRWRLCLELRLIFDGLRA